MILDLMMDLRKANGDKAMEDAAHAKFNEQKRMGQTAGDAATSLLRECVGPDGQRLLDGSERVELAGGQLVTVPLN